jgi:hypothetical protein
MKRVNKHLTYANVVATLALIVAVAGGSTAIAVSHKVKKNSVGTKQLKKGSVTPAKLAPGAVTVDKLADGNVTASKLAGINLVAAPYGPGGGTTARCPAPERLLSGGVSTGGGTVLESAPLAETPVVQWEATSTGGGPSMVYALCLKNTPGS